VLAKTVSRGGAGLKASGSGWGGILSGSVGVVGTEDGLEDEFLLSMGGIGASFAIYGGGPWHTHAHV